MLFLLHLLLAGSSFPGSNSEELSIQMPGVVTPSGEMYLCTSLQTDIKDIKRYITGFAPSDASKESVHHMLLYGCSGPGRQDSAWLCGHDGSGGQGGFQHGGVCSGGQKIMYAWARDAPPLNLPDEVAFTVGGDSGINTLVLQVHFAVARQDPDYAGVKMTVSPTPPKKHAGVMLLGNWMEIKPKSTAYLDVSCQINEDVALHPFGFRTHAHNLSPVISGYWVKDKSWTLIGKMDPHKPQMFYPVEQDMEIRRGDTVAARCTMVNPYEHPVYMGSTNNDEMCNFYMMYWTEGDLLSSDSCWSGVGGWAGLGDPPADASEIDGTQY